MRLLRKVLPPDHKLLLFGDTHLGTIMSHKSGLEKIKRLILSEPDIYAFHMGDAIEAITCDDKRYDWDSIDMNKPIPFKQAKFAAQELEPIRDRLLGMLIGNHEMKLHIFGNLVHDVICEDLGIDYGTYSCRLSVMDSDGFLMYKAFLHHGWGSINSTADDPIRREANMKLMLKRKLQAQAGDCHIMAMAHTHKLLLSIPEEELYLQDDGESVHDAYTKPSGQSGYIDPNLRWYANTGSQVKLYADNLMVSGYAERAMYNPTALGCILFTVQDGQIVKGEKILT